MNVIEYKKQKLLNQVKEKTNDNFRERCYACLRPKKACFCSTIKPFKTNFQFCILMHTKEAKRERNGTGRLTHLTLSNSSIIVGNDFDNNNEFKKFLNTDIYYPMLLYPGINSINLSEETFDKELIKNKIPVLIILDGTWPCAKTMMRDSKCLHGLPRISFTTNIESKFSIKQQPAKFCLSTIESTYTVLYELEKQGLENMGDLKENLLKSLERLVQFQIRCANDPSLQHFDRDTQPYTNPNKRKPSKKWNARTICFRDE